MVDIDNPVKEEVKEEVSTQQALEILQKEQKERIANCSKEVNAILEKYKCTFDVSMTIRQGSINPQINLIALNPQQEL